MKQCHKEYKISIRRYINDSKQICMPVAYTLGPPYALGTNVPRDTGLVRGEALCDAPVPGPW